MHLASKRILPVLTFSIIINIINIMKEGASNPGSSAQSTYGLAPQLGANSHGNIRNKLFNRNQSQFVLSFLGRKKTEIKMNSEEIMITTLKNQLINTTRCLEAFMGLQKANERREGNHPVPFKKVLKKETITLSRPR